MKLAQLNQALNSLNKKLKQLKHKVNHKTLLSNKISNSLLLSRLLNNIKKFHSNKRIQINLLIRDNLISNKDFSKQLPLMDSLSLLVRKLIRTTHSKDSSIHKYLNKDHRLITVNNLLSPTSFLKQ